ncbi:MAG: penicillin-binding protein [Brevibacillus sp.]|nr:penicillin-binding protein [Brevibacillus sp.]
MEEKKPEQSHIPFRLNILFFIVFIFFAAIILRLAYVQLVEGEQYKHDLEMYSTRELPIPAPRGRILDRNGVVLVSNKPVYTVTYVEEQDQDIDEERVAEKLATILKLDEEPGTDKELLKRAVELHTTLPVSLGPKETAELIERLKERLNRLPKVEKVPSLSNTELVKSALLAGMRVKAYLDEEQLAELKEKLAAVVKEGAKNLAYMSEYQLLQTAFSNDVEIAIPLEKNEREELIKELTAQLKALPRPVELAEMTDMELLGYASRFDFEVTLPLSDAQRTFQWNKLTLLKEMRSYNLPSYVPRRVKVNISEQEMAKIVERRMELPGVDVIVEPIRQIREDDDDKNFATHVLGSTVAIRPEQLDEYLARGYSPTDRVGELGLELYYEEQLRGRDGVMEVHVNKNSEMVEKRMRQPAEPGNDLVLAMDWRFQSKVEEILRTSIQEIRSDPKKSKEISEAHAIVMNPKTGEILAMASYPDYNLNLHYNREEFNKRYHTEILPNQRNDLINAAYAPGSTVKPISVMIALQEGLTTPNETIYDTGGLNVGNVYMKNWRAGGHGRVDARRALQVSNNTYMYAMALRLAEKAYSQNKSYKEQFAVLDYYNAQFGLGVKTGVDLPGEITGWFAKDTYLGNLAHAFIGQYDNFTPMQLAQYVSTLANDGYRLRPHFVKEIRKGTTDPDQPGPVLTVMKPEVLNRIEIDPKWLKVIQEGMRMVTMPGGTAYYSFKDLPFTVAAKTGTAQTGSAADNSLIIGYAPYEDPQVSFVVIVPKGGHGSDSSGPIARKILEAYHQLYPLSSSAPVQTEPSR